MKKSVGLALSIFGCLSIAAIIASQAHPKISIFGSAEKQSYNFTLNSSQFASSGLGSEFNTADPKKFSSADYVQQTFSGPDSPVINYFLAKKDSSNNLVLAPGGQVFNYSTTATYNGRITGINSITVNYSGGALYVQEGDAGSNTIYNKRQALMSGSTLSLASVPNFVMISNSRANTTITNITYTYSCFDAGYIVGRLGEIYNGAASNGTPYTLTRNGNSVTFNGQSGTISVTNSGGFTMSLNSGAVTYSGTISQDYKTLSITGTTGSALDINELHRVYVLDDFEGYSQTGTGLRSGKTVASDLRFAYYGDYGGGGYSTWVTNSSFDSAQSADYVNLTTAVKHGGSKSATFKGWTGGWTRAWSREAFDTLHHYNFGSGNLLSFWAHGPYTDTACTTDSTKAGKIRVQVYYEKFDLTDSNRNSTTYGSGTTDFTIPASSGWTQYTIPLNRAKNVYAINIMVDNSSISGYKNIYIPIDDIQIMENPVFAPQKMFNESSTRITKTYHGMVTVGNILGSLDYTVKIGLGANGYIYAYAGADMVPTGYTISGNQITITTTGTLESKFGNYTFGNWVGTLSNNMNTLTINKNNVSGSIASVIKTTNIVLNEDTVLADGSESNSTLQSMFTKQTGDPWETLSDPDRIVQTSDYYIKGSSCIKMSANGTTRIRMILNPSLAQSWAANIQSVSFWVYMPAGTNFTMQLFSYNSYNPSTDFKTCVTYAINTSGTSTKEPGWQYVNCGLEENYGKNISIAITVNAGANPAIIDYITYF